MALNIASIFGGTGPALSELMRADRRLSDAENALKDEASRASRNASRASAADSRASAADSRASAALAFAQLVARERDQYRTLLEEKEAELQAQAQNAYDLKRLIHGEAATVQTLAEALHRLQPGHPLLHYTEDGSQMRISDELYQESMRVADSAIPLEAPNRPSYWSEVPRKQT